MIFKNYVVVIIFFLSTVAVADELKPFQSDGCSAFPDGSLRQNNLWLRCCRQHDYAYWKGGAYDERLTADQELKACVEKVGEPKIAAIMLAGVRVGGTPYLPTTFRWGYGWSYPKLYGVLSEEERSQIQQQETLQLSYASELSKEMNADIETIVRIRSSYESMQAYMLQHTDLFLSDKATDKRLTTREQRKEIWSFWKSFLDRVLMLDMLGKKYDLLYKNTTGIQQEQAFRITYAAFLLQYRYAIEFISMFENDPSMHTMLNEPVPELGLDENIYKRLKFRFLNVVRAAEFARMNLAYKFYGVDGSLALSEGVEFDSNALWKFGVGEGTAQTLKNASTIIKDAAVTAWFPLQASVSEWMGDVKVLRSNYSLISIEQIADIKKLLLPGDILLERREWYLSNIGLPGYWPHAALYIGTAEQRSNYFDDEVVQHYAVDGGFESVLKNKYPEAYLKSMGLDDYGHIPRVIEAISEGVSFTSLEHSVDADSVAILRPNLSKLEKSQAIERAFHFSGRPYDFDFDFLTDSELVCTELIYKVYEPQEQFSGLTFPTRKIIGRTVTTANDMVKMVDVDYQSGNSQLEFIAFYDGHERNGNAVKSDFQSFRNSWKRPKMFIWLQDTLLEPKLE